MCTQINAKKSKKTEGTGGDGLRKKNRETISRVRRRDKPWLPRTLYSPSVHCKTQESMTSEPSISSKRRIPNHRISMTNLLCPVNSKWTRGLFMVPKWSRSFPSILRDGLLTLFTFQLINGTVCPLCAAKGSESSPTTAAFMLQNVILQLESELELPLHSCSQ